MLFISDEGHIQVFPGVMDPQAGEKEGTQGPDDRETPVWALGSVSTPQV